MKKHILIPVVLSMTMAASLIGCSGGSSKDSNNSSTPFIDSIAQQVNEWKDYLTLESAEDAVGYDIVLPFDNSESDIYRGLNNELLEVIHSDGNTVTIRKGTGNDDVSGDYNSYSYSTDADGITYKGDSKDQISLATWNNGGYSYSIYVETPISLDEMQTLVKGTN